MKFIEFFQYGVNQRRRGIIGRENQEGQWMNLIRNEREYAHTKRQIEDFDRALTELETAMRKGGSREEKAHAKMQHSAHLRLIGSLRQQVEEYDALQNGAKTVFHCGRMEELPRALIKARIARHLSIDDLARRLGCCRSMMEKYEETEYEGATWGEILSVAESLGVEMESSLHLIEIKHHESSVQQLAQEFEDEFGETDDKDFEKKQS